MAQAKKAVASKPGKVARQREDTGKELESVLELVRGVYAKTGHCVPVLADLAPGGEVKLLFTPAARRLLGDRRIEALETAVCSPKCEAAIDEASAAVKLESALVEVKRRARNPADKLD